MTEFLPPVVLQLKADISDLVSGLAEASAAIRAFAASIPDDLKGVQVAFTSAGHTAGINFVHEVREQLDRLDDEETKVRASGEKAGRGFVMGFDSALKGLGKVILPIGPMPSMWAGLIGAAGQAAPVLLNTTGLIGLIPAAAGAAALAIGSLTTAFHGFGGAVSAGMSGDLTKYNQALAGMAPAAQQAVRAVVGLKPLLDQLRTTVAQNFWTKWAGDIRLLGNTYLPLLRQQMGGVATALGAGLRQILQLANTPAMVATVTGALDLMRQAISRMSGAFAPVVDALLKLMRLGAQFLPDFGGGVAALAQQFDAFVTRITSNGQLVGWIKSALSALSQLGLFLKDLGTIVAELFDAMGAAGNGTLGILGQLARQLATFFGSAAGMQGLVAAFKILGDFATLLGDAIGAVLPLLAAVLKPLAPIADQLLTVLVRVIDALAGALMPVIAALMPALVALAAALMPLVQLIGEQLAVVLVALAPVLAQIITLIGGLLLTAIQAVLPAVMELLPPLVQLAVAVLPLLVPVVKLVAWALGLLAGPIAWVANLLAAILVPAINLLTNIFLGDWLSSVGGWFESVGKSISKLVDGVGAWFAALPGRIWAGIKAIPGLLVKAISLGFQGLAFAIGFGAGLFVRAVAAIFIGLPLLIAKLFSDLVGLMVTFAIAAGKWLASLPALIFTTIVGIVTWVHDHFQQMRTDTINAIVGLVLGVIKEIKSLPSQIVAFVKDARTWLLQAGTDVILGLIDGITNAFHFVSDAIHKLGGDVASGFKSALGISSPSKVFTAFGGHIVAGLVKGVDTNAHLATSAVTRMLSGLGGAGPNLAFGGAAIGGSLVGSGGGYVPVHVSLGGQQMAVIHAALIPTSQRYKQRTGTTGLT